MAVKAQVKYLRIAPRKVRLTADLIRGKKLAEAQTMLSFISKKSSSPLLKLLKQAAANAKNNFQMEEDNLFISEIIVDEGPKYKRWRARARGQAYEIQKKTSHVTLVLDQIKKKKIRKAKAQEAEKLKEDKSSSRLSPASEGSEKLKEDKKTVERTRQKIEKTIAAPKRTRRLQRIFRRKAV